jgi:hypothetical protein
VLENANETITDGWRLSVPDARPAHESDNAAREEGF